MDPTAKPYVQISIDEVYSVVLDPEGAHDPEHFDRYATYQEARDAALSCIELTLDAGDYDDEAHRAELEQMLRLLEAAEDFDRLSRHRDYRRFLRRRAPAGRAVA